MKSLKIGIAFSAIVISSLSFAQKAPDHIKSTPIRVSSRSLNEPATVISRAEQEKKAEQNESKKNPTVIKKENQIQEHRAIDSKKSTM